ncbi:MAG TPA: methyltransferase domain-containing protein [Solirubrobacteraceae bacterium]|nr:methyltransferase domain-containing protein [Solirubrobacteraceae bacterium]
MRWNTPLSEDHAALLLDWLAVGPSDTVLDLGCGWGELLMRAVARTRGEGAAPAVGIGVDIDPAALDRARWLAATRGLEGSVSFQSAQAESWDRPVSRLITIGTAHAWGDGGRALGNLANLLAPGGRMLFGEGCWERTPTDAAAALFAGDVLPLGDLICAARSAGLRVLHMSTADQREWDEFESTWRAGREEWLLANRNHGDSGTERAELDARLDEYVSIYRGVLGFCYLVLAR